MQIYIYPFQMQQKLIRATCYGNEKMLRDIYHGIIEKNERLNLSDNVKKTFLCDLIGTLMKCFRNVDSEENEVEDFLSHLYEMLNSEIEQSTWDNLLEYFIIACQTRLKADMNNNDYLIKKAIDFIENNYSNSSINLAMVSDCLGISEKMTSNLFLESVNTRFSVYLENIRMHRAVQYLSQTERSVEEISALVGYTSSHSFRRAYKRFFDTNPRELRL